MTRAEVIGSTVKPDSVRPISKTERQIWLQKTGSMCRPISKNGFKGASQRLRYLRNVAMTDAVTAKLSSRNGPRCHLSNSHVCADGSEPPAIELQPKIRKEIPEKIKAASDKGDP